MAGRGAEPRPALAVDRYGQVAATIFKESTLIACLLVQLRHRLV